VEGIGVHLQAPIWSNSQLNKAVVEEVSGKLVKCGLEAADAA
jgi:hypothetical protein